VTSLKKQNDDIDMLIANMKFQFSQMRTDYSDQLNNIEKAFYDERSQILTRNEKEIEQLFNEHRSLEEKFQHRLRKTAGRPAFEGRERHGRGKDQA
jgi:recombinational DNA repair ATPase RecF